MTTAQNVTLDGRTWNLDGPAYGAATASLPDRVARSRLLMEAGPSALLGAAARMCSTSAADARRLLRKDFAMRGDRAKLAVRVGAALCGDDRTSLSPLGFLAGGGIGQADHHRVAALLTAPSRDDGADARRVSMAAVERAWRAGRPRQVASAAARSGDYPSQAVACALLAGMRTVDATDFAQALFEALPPQLATRGARKSSQRADRVIACAYALDAARDPGLDLGGQRWDAAPRPWRFRAALWALPTLNPGKPTALARLLDAIHQRGLSLVPPGEMPFPVDANPSELRFAQNHASGLTASLKRWTDRPLWFDGASDYPQVLLTQDDEYAYAWVGQANKGMLVSFHTGDFTGYGLPEPGMRFALAAAIGWYLDVSVSLPRSASGTTTIQRTGRGNATTGISYKPTLRYMSQMRNVAQGHVKPPRPHWVSGFVRHLTTGTPNPAQVAAAPSRLRSIMGRGDTYVRPHARGSGTAAGQYKTRLSSHSALADIVGLIQRGP